MKILVFSQYFYPENFRINTLCRELVLRGHDVTVVTGYPQYPGGEIFDGYGFGLPYAREWHGVKIQRLKVPPRGHNVIGLLRNCIGYVTAGNKWVKQCKEKFDAVFVFEVSPVTVGLPAVSYKKKFGTPIFFNLQDLWPENVHEVLGIRFPPLTFLINRIVDKIYANSDRILCASKGFVENLCQRGVSKDKLTYWPQFCLPPDEESLKRPSIYSDDTFNVVFAGNIGDAQGLDLLLEVAEKLKGQNIRWHLVGDGRAKARLEKLTSQKNLQNDVNFVGRVSESDANSYVAYADCAYLSFANNKLFNLMLPAKLQTYLACGTPILAAAAGESAAIIADADCGKAIPPDADALAAEMKRMATAPAQIREQYAKNAKSYYEAHFTMDKLVNQLLDMMLHAQ